MEVEIEKDVCSPLVAGFWLVSNIFEVGYKKKQPPEGGCCEVHIKEDATSMALESPSMFFPPAVA